MTNILSKLWQKLQNRKVCTKHIIKASRQIIKPYFPYQTERKSKQLIIQRNYINSRQSITVKIVLYFNVLFIERKNPFLCPLNGAKGIREQAHNLASRVTDTLLRGSFTVCGIRFQWNAMQCNGVKISSSENTISKSEANFCTIFVTH